MLSVAETGVTIDFYASRTGHGWRGFRSLPLDDYLRRPRHFWHIVPSLFSVDALTAKASRSSNGVREVGAEE